MLSETAPRVGRRLKERVAKPQACRERHLQTARKAAHRFSSVSGADRHVPVPEHSVPTIRLASEA